MSTTKKGNKKRLLVSLFAILCCMGTWADVRINSTNFPDVFFRKWLLGQSYGADGILTASEIESVTSINVSNKSIKSLQGIEYFTALRELDCY